MLMVDSVRYLGVHIDGDLSYGTQVGKMPDETRKGLALLGKLERYALNSRRSAWCGLSEKSEKDRENDSGLQHLHQVFTPHEINS